MELLCPHCNAEAHIGYILDKGFFAQCLNDHKFAIGFNLEESGVKEENE